MSDESIRLEIPYFIHKPVQHLRSIKWCDKHWADLMLALTDRGLGGMIAPSADALSEKFLKGEYDPCWDACNRINMGALEVFGPDKLIEEHKGCPVCAFSHMVGHITDLVAAEHGSH